jgi:prostaglandin-endoperoxide synthase 2
MSKPPVRAGFEIPGMAPLPRELFLLLKAPYLPPGEGLKRMRHRFAMGVERANSQIGYVMLNVLFLREHNRLCKLLKDKHPTWDDERLYQTARNTVIVMLIRIVVEEYINHISPYNFKFRAQPQSFYDYRWQRPNWMALEFALLYRWHGLVPDNIDVGTRTFSMIDTLLNNALLLEEGIATAIDSASKQKASVVGLMNTAPLLVRTAELPSLIVARAAHLRSYNDYREFARFPRVRHFDEITENEELQKRLQDVYKEPDNIEFFVGLFAEDAPPNSAVPPLIGRLVAVDAFSQALTNPLLSEHVFKPETFAEGWVEFQNTPNLEAVVRRNIPGERTDVLVTMTQK